MSTTLVSTGSLAAHFGVTAQTIREWMREGLIEPALITPGGHVRWDVEKTDAQFVKTGTLVSSHNDEQGFTLIELLVVILIIGILLAIALPAFLGQQDKAHDSEAKQSLAVAYRVATGAAVEINPQGHFPDADTLRTKIANSEPEFTVAAGTDPAESELAVVSSGGGDLLMSYLSKSGHLCTVTVEDQSKPLYSCEEVAVSGGGGYYGAVIASGPESYYRLGDPDGSLVVDDTGGRDATYNNGTCTFGATGIPDAGAGDTALSSNGSCFLSAPAAPTLGASFSVEFWFKASTPNAPNSGRVSQGFFALMGPDGPNLWAETSFVAGAEYTLLNIATTTGERLAIMFPYSWEGDDGNWHQIVLVIDNDQNAVPVPGWSNELEYFDGVFRGGGPFPDVPRLNSTSLEIARAPFTQQQMKYRENLMEWYSYDDYWNWNGVDPPPSGPATVSLKDSMDELAFYNKALTPEEVANHYSLGIAP